MKEYSTHLLISEDGYPPSHEEVGRVISEKAQEGWHFLQIATAGYATFPLNTAQLLGKVDRSYSSNDEEYTRDYELNCELLTNEIDYDYTAWTYLIFDRD